FHTLRGQIGWPRNTLDNFLTPNTGMLQRFTAEVALPGSTVEYFKLNYEISKFWRLNRHLVLNTRGELGYGDSYGDDFVRNVCFTPGTISDANGDGIDDTYTPGPDPTEPCLTTSPDYRKTLTASGLPFFENFYAGGVRSVRGFSDNTLGPRAAAAGSNYLQPIGGSLKTVGSLEMFFPTLINSPAARVSAFVDVGNVFSSPDDFDANELRASTGLSVMWRSPMGPISISYSYPIRKQDGDELERLQFTFGGVF
ncbi:MAG TPA: BamA/TamA family outer membrane protein, partial [Lysobacter sp.]|nr:BamA/TamA family outer membrane protein [Lysobacter sp.]